MSIGRLKQTNLTALLPRGIEDSLVCYTLTNSEAVPDSPDAITCHGNGYLYEIKNKKIIRSLNLNETASSVRCYCLPENGKIVLFYVVHTTGSRLMLVRRSYKYLKVVQDYNRVQDFQIYDFQCLGFPQIKLTLLNEGGSVICKFPVETSEETCFDEDSSTMPYSLDDEFQILNTHIDGLTEEYNQLKKICFFNDEPNSFENIFAGSVKFALPLDEAVQHKLTVSNKWLKVFGNSLILGMKLSNKGTEITRDVEITINHNSIKDYAYSFYQSSNDIGSYLFSPRRVTRSVEPSEEIHAVVTFNVPELFDESEFAVPFCVSCSGAQQRLLSDTFEVKVQDVASRTTVGLEKLFTAEDLLAVKATKREIRVEIRADDLGDRSLESILTESLGFKKIKHAKDKLFYCTSTYLREVFVGFRHITENPSVWKMLIFSSDLSQVYFLINALYEFLPENAEISCDGD